MTKSFRNTLYLAAMGISIACQAQTPLVGTWELVYVAPQNIEYTAPGGVTNTKMHVTSDGRIYSVKPEAVSLQGAPSTSYTFDGKVLKVAVPGGKDRLMAVAFPDQETMLVTQQYETQRTFKRISSFDKKLEPRSLQLVVDNSSPETPAVYDTRDYSGLSLPERLKGFWETIAFEKVPRHQVPPYGFLNDLWNITGEKVTITRRNHPVTDSVPFSLLNGQLSSSGISLGGPAGSKVDWVPHFNEWGHLVLDSSYCRVVLKLVSKDPKAAPSIPLKVVLLDVK
ncbi:MAG TPA: hypothetical protein VGK03_09895 [Geothrix sp.]|jgi:hypothetical protein